MTKKILMLPLLVAFSLLAGCWTTQSGQKSGIIVKVAKEGRWWGTYEGELIRGGLDNASGATGREFHFTLGQFKSDLVEKAIYAMENNRHVVLTYHCEEFVAPWRGETRCFVDSIRILDTVNKPAPPKQ
ncbi:hypothetical protein DIZ81_03615 [Legionella taurinensis]|uniref:Secreted protein n=1 Tax=Legionella taurinensis TaxID=70611 RepID=A0A3A5LA29_9GAMM|nr:hypothetical protein [Legionella taurinensis]MDX1836752.1 hypothetical protein [Legionella taurinensis]PUT41175.1 hypothetical protein DB744_03615 [Legionella taurinensis]PUT42300.1 hypothetical protein DB746_07545 [Legionella taurinensis]PUT43825.1 hypothetical protein DB743_09495 [Legionella taurinensis]PUT47081.1 hypothetical protein DB745_08625 [Legionella taurinensis]